MIIRTSAEKACKAKDVVPLLKLAMRLRENNISADMLVEDGPFQEAISCRHFRRRQLRLRRPMVVWL